MRIVFAALLCCSLCCPGIAARPNIIFVLTDDQGYGDLGCHGNPVLQTPHIDAFYRQSVRFTDFNVSPTCAPTRSALMTGRHEFRNGVTHTIYERERLTTNAVTIAHVLKSAGYKTGIFGKWHLGDEPAYQPDRRGFDEVFIHGGGGIGQTYPGSCGDAPGNSYFDPAILHNGRFEKTKGYCTDVFFRQALSWIDQQRGQGQPFFAYIALNAPHAPLECPADYVKQYAGKVGTNAARFFGMIANIDDNFGALTAKLREWNMETNTLVIFMTDNGGTAGTPVWNAGMRGQKGTPWLGGTRVPSFWRWPAAFKGGRDCEKLTAHVDVFRTLAEVAGATLSRQAQAQAEGRSLVPLLKNQTADWADRTLVTHVGRWPHGQVAEAKYSNCSIRNSRYQLVSVPKRNPGRTAQRKGEARWELYDLREDPAEMNNIAERRPEIVRDLDRDYEKWWAEVQPMLVNEEVPAPAVNPFKALYWAQLGGGPDEKLRRQMDPRANTFVPLLHAAEGAGRIIEYGDDGRIAWEYPAEYSRDAWRLPNGNTLFCYNREYSSSRHDNPSGAMEVTRDKKIVWEYSTTGQVWACQRLVDGNTLVGAASQGKLLIVSPEAKLVTEIVLRNKPGHSCIRNARQVPGGNFLVAEESAHAVREYGPDGSFRSEIKINFPPYSAVRLTNGNTVICGQKSMVEVDRNGKTVWSLAGAELPEMGIRWFAGIQVLPNGNIFISNAGGSVPFLEVSREKKVVWNSGPGNPPFPIGHGVQRLDITTPPLK